MAKYFELKKSFAMIAARELSSREKPSPKPSTRPLTFTSRKKQRLNFNLDKLLATLSSVAATGTTLFYNTTAGGSNTPDTVYGLFNCRGVVPRQVCQDCVARGTKELSSKCEFEKEGMLWRDQCFVRYSNRYFFSVVEKEPILGFFNTINVTTNNNTDFITTLAKTLTQVVAEAANSGVPGNKNFATKKASLSLVESRSLYTCADCTSDLSSKDCYACLHEAINSIPGVVWERLGEELGILAAD
ncbi:cysteine-rich receptor-like protein kinase 25 [Abrus precatorius]|uniref:Cysteine-rich receptor-like protein kinase 25 n=1 Tax=Abrus precatorius TaxID=3816 RepID=A0A8B8M890_ABRPR|nr:cysteine-rich receptor-like protein kinase 25 [Abrus precatorius]